MNSQYKKERRAAAGGGASGLSRRLLLSLPFGTVAGLAEPAAAGRPRMLWGDSSRFGRPFSKDPAVVRMGERYLLYYSLPAMMGSQQGWGIGIAESRDLAEWAKVGEVEPEQECERKGLCAPCARVIGGEVHLFYQTYGNAERDAICHAVSADGVRFRKDASNPVFRPTGEWNCGRAIDADVVEHEGRWLLYAATRDVGMKRQMVVGAVAEKGRGFGREAWRMLADRPLLEPELEWEKDCVEAPAVVRHGGSLYMFYAGAYNNAPQQIGCARSRDGVNWQRISKEPVLANGRRGEWNSSESGHPWVFEDRDGAQYLFFQGNNTEGRTWLLSYAKLSWRGETPVIVMP